MGELIGRDRHLFKRFRQESEEQDENSQKGQDKTVHPPP
jgi:hypothetical protein